LALQIPLQKEINTPRVYSQCFFRALLALLQSI